MPMSGVNRAVSGFRPLDRRGYTAYHLRMSSSLCLHFKLYTEITGNI